MAGGSESDYREVVFEREGKEPLHGFMRPRNGDRQRVWSAQRKAAWLVSAGVYCPIAPCGVGERRTRTGGPKNGITRVRREAE
jgi:hypothetical protein